MADEQIVTSITAKADFSQLIRDLNHVTTSLASLQEKAVATNKALSNQIAVINRGFADTMRSTGQFSTHYVSLTSDVEKFGRSLESGRLKLKDYYRVWNDHARTSGGLIRQLAQQQVQLQNAILQPLGRNAQGLMQFNVHVPRGLDLIKNKTALTIQELKIMNKVVQDGAVQLINWGKNTQWAGRQLTVGLTLPLAAFGKAAADAFRQADSELTRLTKVYGDIAGTSSADLARIRKDVAATSKELAQSMGVNFTETIALAADIAATGKTGNELLSSVSETTRLAVLGEVDRQEAMKATLAIQTAFKQNTQELSESINFLNAVENQTSTSLADLVEAIPKAGPVVKSLGGGIKELALYLTAMREGGINASESANAIKSGLASLINPTKQTVGLMKDFGIDILGMVQKNAGNTTSLLLDLQSALDRLDPLQKAQAIEQMFGKFQFARISALLNNLGRQGSQTLQVLDLMKASTADLEQVASRELSMVTESAAGRYKRALESLKANLADVGEEFLKIGTFIVSVLDKIITFGQKLPDPLKKLIAFGTAFTAMVGPVIMLTGLLANFFGYIVKGVFHFKSLFKGAEGWKLLTPEILAANKAGSIAEQTFYSDAKAASVLKQALADLATQYDVLVQKASSGAISVSPVISTLGGQVATTGGYRPVNSASPFVGGMASSHLNPRDPNNPATIFGLVPGSDIVNQRIGRTPQIMMEDRLPNIEGLTSVRSMYKGAPYDVSTGVVASEAARYQALIATLGMQSQQEIAALKNVISTGGAVSSEFIATFDDILPLTTTLSTNAARQSAAIVAELRAGKLSVEQAKAEIIAVNAQLERDLGIAVTSYAQSTGRSIDLTKVPMVDQPVVDARGSSNMRALFRRGRFRGIMQALGRATRTRTMGAPYSIETTIPPKFNSGGLVYSPSSGQAIVPGPQSVNYDIVPANVPLGGFVLNQAATRNNPDLARMAGSGYGAGGKTTPAMLTPGEAVFSPEFTAANYELLSAANSGMKIKFHNTGGFVGGLINSNKFNYGNISLDQKTVRDLLAKYVKLIEDPAYEQNVKARSVMLDASELMGLGFDPEDAVNIATDMYDEAFTKARGKNGMVDTAKFARIREEQLRSIQQDVKKFFPGKSAIYQGSAKSQGVKTFKQNSALIKAMMTKSGRFDPQIIRGIDLKNFARAHFIRRGQLGIQGIGYLLQAGILPRELNTLQNLFEQKGLTEDKFDPSQAGARKTFERAIRAAAGPEANIDDVSRALAAPTKFPKAADVQSGRVATATPLQRKILQALISRMLMPKGALALRNSGGLVGGLIRPGKYNYGVTPIQGMPGVGMQNAAYGGHDVVSQSPKQMGMMGGMLLGTAGMFAGSALGGKVAGQGGSMVGGILGSMIPSMMMFQGGLKGILSSLTRVHAGLLVTAAAVYGLKKAYDAHQQTLKKQSLAYGLDEQAAAKAGLTYVDTAKKLTAARDVIEASRQKMELLYATIAQAAPGAKLNLTIDQLQKLKAQVKDTMPDYIELINQTNSSAALNKLSTSLKAQFMSAGQSVEKATQTVYALIAASEKANMALSAVTSSSFQAVKSLSDAAIASARNVREAAFQANQAVAPWTKNGRIQGLANSLNTFFQATNVALEDLIKNGEKQLDGTVKQVSASEALNIQYANMEKSGLKNVKVTGDMKAALSQIDPMLGAMVTTGNSLYGVYAKYRLLLQGIKRDLTGLNDDQAAILSAYSDALNAGVIKNLTSDYGMLGNSVTKLNKLNTDLAKLEAAARGQSAKKQIDTRKEIELINEKIDAINKEADAKKKALQEEQEAEDVRLQIKQRQLDYQNALAAGDMQAAAQAQLEIQRLVNQQQLTLAEKGIDVARDKQLEPLEKRKKALQNADQAAADRAALAGDSISGKASERDKLTTAMQEFNSAYSTFRNDIAMGNLKVGSQSYQKTIVALLQLFKNAGGDSKYYAGASGANPNTVMLNQAEKLIKSMQAGTQSDVDAALKDAASQLKEAGIALGGSAGSITNAANGILSGMGNIVDATVKKMVLGGGSKTPTTVSYIPYDKSLKEGTVIRDKQTGQMYTVGKKIGKDRLTVTPKKALGGRVSPGYGYIVGEHRPEYFKPDTGGYIYPNIGTANYNVPTQKANVNGYQSKLGASYNVKNEIIVNAAEGQDANQIAMAVARIIGQKEREAMYKFGEPINYGGRA